MGLISHGDECLLNFIWQLLEWPLFRFAQIALCEEHGIDAFALVDCIFCNSAFGQGYRVGNFPLHYDVLGFYARKSNEIQALMFQSVVSVYLPLVYSPFAKSMQESSIILHMSQGDKKPRVFVGVSGGVDSSVAPHQSRARCGTALI